MCSLHAMPALHSRSDLHICASGRNFPFPAVIFPKYSTITSPWQPLKQECPFFSPLLFNERQTWSVYITALMLPAGTWFSPGAPRSISLSRRPTEQRLSQPGTALEAICSHPGARAGIDAKPRCFIKGKAAIKSVRWRG